MEINKIAELLGENNTQRLKDGITDIILDNINQDFDYYERYILDPDEITEFIEQCKQEAFNNVKGELVVDFEKKIREVIN